jgi:hypothetical protein
MGAGLNNAGSPSNEYEGGVLFVGVNLHGFIDREAPVGVPWVGGFNARMQLKGDGKYWPRGMSSCMFYALVEKYRRFMGDI